MATICLYGNISEFGNRFKLDVRDTAEAIRLLTSQLPKLKSMLKNGYYRLRVDKQETDSESLNQNMSYCLHENSIVHIVPVIQGAKEGGLFGIVLGAVMIGAAFFTGGTSIAAWGAMQTGLAMAGGAMMLSGAAMMLTPLPKVNEQKQQEQSKSTSFSSLDNMIPQGRPVPLIYGEIMIGSLVVAQQLETMDEVI